MSLNILTKQPIVLNTSMLDFYDKKRKKRFPKKVFRLSAFYTRIFLELSNEVHKLWYNYTQISTQIECILTQKVHFTGTIFGILDWIICFVKFCTRILRYLHFSVKEFRQKNALMVADINKIGNILKYSTGKKLTSSSDSAHHTELVGTLYYKDAPFSKCRIWRSLISL